MNEEQDQALVKRTLRGDKKAFEMIVRKYQQPLLNYVGRMVGEREMALDCSILSDRYERDHGHP